MERIAESKVDNDIIFQIAIESWKDCGAEGIQCRRVWVGSTWYLSQLSYLSRLFFHVEIFKCLWEMSRNLEFPWFVAHRTFFVLYAILYSVYCLSLFVAKSVMSREKYWTKNCVCGEKGQIWGMRQGVPPEVPPGAAEGNHELWSDPSRNFLLLIQTKNVD